MVRQWLVLALACVATAAPRHSLTILVFPTTVDTHRHGERRAGIMSTWGRNQRVRGWRVRTLFIESAGPGLDVTTATAATGADWTGGGNLSTPADLKPTGQFLWALEVLQAQQARARSARGGRGGQTWYFKADSVTFVLVDSLVRVLGDAGRAQAASPLYLARKVATTVEPQRALASPSHPNIASLLPQMRTEHATEREPDKA